MPPPAGRPICPRTAPIRHRPQDPELGQQNSYLSDQTGSTGTALRAAEEHRQVFHADLSARFGPFDDEPGPNQSCRSPIVELTNNQKRMRDAINAMQPGGYTHIPQGLVWGWRVLSPGEPFTQGVAYDDTTTQKALVLLSDGKNTFPETYTSYGYQADGRLASTSAPASATLNEKVTTICEAVKAKGIRLYMILLEENDPRHDADFPGLRVDGRRRQARSITRFRTRRSWTTPSRTSART